MADLERQCSRLAPGQPGPPVGRHGVQAAGIVEVEVARMVEGTATVLRQGVQMGTDQGAVLRVHQEKMHQRPGVGINDVVAKAVPVVPIHRQEAAQGREAAGAAQPGDVVQVLDRRGGRGIGLLELEPFDEFGQALVEPQGGVTEPVAEGQVGDLVARHRP